MGFDNGVWKCNCDPPQAAVKKKVSKDNDNKGKLFYSCRLPMKDPKQCNFFFWYDEALKHEAAALQNVRNNVNPSVTTPIKRDSSPPPQLLVDAGHSEPSRKRKQPVNRAQDDEFDGGIDDNALHERMIEIETPSKAAKTIQHATPATIRRRLWDLPKDVGANGLPTPQTNRRSSNNLFGPEYPAPVSSFFTPSRDNAEDSYLTITPSSSAESSRSRSQNTDGNLAQEVLSLLQEARVTLSSNSERDLKALLSKHARCAEGYRRGRDLAHQTLKARDAKANELYLRIHTLEAELEAEKQRVANLEWEAQNPEAT